jgi:hypothetical protein
MAGVKYTADGLPYYDATDQQTQPYFPQANGPMLPAPGIPGTMPEAWNAGVRGLAGSLMDTLAAPGRAMQGGYAVRPSVPGLWSEEDEFRRQHAQGKQVADAGSLGLNLAGQSPFAKPGQVGIFGGRLAATADQAALAKAEEMAAKGAGRDEIWNQTGWFQGADQKWRFEIPDNKSQLGQKTVEDLAAKGETRGKIAGAVWHKDLYDAYPDLRSMDASLYLRDKPSGALLTSQMDGRPIGTDTVMAIGRTNDETRSVALHELQHAVQKQEGFARGISSEDLAADANFPKYEMAHALAASRGLNWVKLSKAERKALTDEVLRERYKVEAGEVEARNVQARMSMTPGQLRATPPWRTQDIPDAMQILKNK